MGSSALRLTVLAVLLLVSAASGYAEYGVFGSGTSRFNTLSSDWFQTYGVTIAYTDANTYEITFGDGNTAFISEALSALGTTTWVSTTSGCEAYYLYPGSLSVMDYCVKNCGVTSYWCTGFGCSNYQYGKFAHPVHKMCTGCSFSSNLVSYYNSNCADPFCNNGMEYYNRGRPPNLVDPSYRPGDCSYAYNFCMYQNRNPSCSGGCTNDCSSGQLRCYGSYTQTCGNYDADSCYDWPVSADGAGSTLCSNGCDAGTGQCNTCTNDCSSGSVRCNGSYSQVCGNYDADSCYDWPASTSGSGNTYCTYGCSAGTCSAAPSCNNYCSSNDRYYNGVYTGGNCSYTTENCNNYDGYTCNGNAKEYHNYYCASAACTYTIDQSTNCDTLDTYGAWQYYCSGSDRWKHRIFYNYSCSGSDCSVASQNFVDDAFAQSCAYGCSAGVCNGCSGSIIVDVEDYYDAPVVNASVYLDGALQGATGADGRITLSGSASACPATHAVRVVALGGVDCTTKNVTNRNAGDNKFMMFTCNVQQPQLRMGVATGSPHYLGDDMTFGVEVKDSANSLISGASVGIWDPLKQMKVWKTTLAGIVEYLTNASRTGYFTFLFSASKPGYKAGSAEKGVIIKQAGKTELIRIENKQGVTTLVFRVSSGAADGTYEVKLNLDNPQAAKYFDALSKTVYVPAYSHRYVEFNMDKELMVGDYYATLSSAADGNLAAESLFDFFNVNPAFGLKDYPVSDAYPNEITIRLSQEDQEKVVGFAMLLWGAYEVYDTVDTVITVGILTSCGICVGGVFVLGVGTPGLPDEIIVLPVCSLCGGGLSAGMIAKELIKRSGKVALEEFVERISKKVMAEGAERVLKKEVKEETGEFLVQYVKGGAVKEVKGNLTEEIVDVSGKKYVNTAATNVVNKVATIERRGFWGLGSGTAKTRAVPFNGQNIAVKSFNKKIDMKMTQKAVDHLEDRKHYDQFKEVFELKGSSDDIKNQTIDKIEDIISSPNLVNGKKEVYYSVKYRSINFRKTIQTNTEPEDIIVAIEDGTGNLNTAFRVDYKWDDLVKNEQLVPISWD